MKWKSSRDATRNQDAWQDMPLAWILVHYCEVIQMTICVSFAWMQSACYNIPIS